MSGNELKEILVSYGYNISEIATKLGFASAQRLHSALGASDVKTGLVEDIARVTQRNIWDFFPEHTKPMGAAVASDSSIAVAGNSNHVSNTSEKLIALLEKKDEQIDRLLFIIETLRKELP
jgi:hypothetical protein